MRKLFIISLFVLAFGCDKNNDEDETNTTELTEIEKNDLQFLREEEKLARDVYLYSYSKYGLSISKNISNSEQTHMDNVLQVMASYNIGDPANADTGIFNNSELQNIYNTLATQVDQSEIDALLVGATIEDLDIKDIEEFIEHTAKEDLIVLYENLMCGSRNHLRSYYDQIIAMDSFYSPQYVTQSEFDNIIDSDKETCGQ